MILPIVLTQQYFQNSSKLNLCIASLTTPQWSSAPSFTNRKPSFRRQIAAAWSVRSHKSSEASLGAATKTKTTPFPRLATIGLSPNPPSRSLTTVKINHSPNPAKLSLPKLRLPLKTLSPRRRFELSVKCKLTMIGERKAIVLCSIWRRSLSTRFW
jgi:hypothetical protein